MQWKNEIELLFRSGAGHYRPVHRQGAALAAKLPAIYDKATSTPPRRPKRSKHGTPAPVTA
jgi:hypothetical protein